MEVEPAPPSAIVVADPSAVGEVRRRVALLASALGFDDAQAGRAGIVVVELARNLVQHAGGGQILLRPFREDDGSRWLELVALDRGPGMVDVDRCMRDGYSTGGTPGTGLGAIARQSELFEIYSAPGAGTVEVVRLSATGRPRVAMPAEWPLEIGAAIAPFPGEVACGDAFAVARRRDGFEVVVVDGLGHGLLAADASRAAVTAFHAAEARAPAVPDLLDELHAALRSTRGAAVALATVDLARRTVAFAGVGNIAASIIDLESGAARGLPSRNGIVGHPLRPARPFAFPWPRHGLLVLHTDGIGAQWRLDRYPGLAARHPSLVAGALFRDWRRPTDDATVVALRPAAAPVEARDAP